MIQTDEVRQVLLDPLGYFEEPLPDPILYVLGLWAERLDPVMTPADFMLSYFGVLHDLQEGHDSRTGEPLRGPLVGLPASGYRAFFILFPTLLPRLLGDRAKEVDVLWRKSIRALRDEEVATR